MKNLFISKLNEKDVDHCTTKFGLFIRRKANKIFIKLCNIFTNARIIKENRGQGQTDENYFNEMSKKIKSVGNVEMDSYDIEPGKNNIIVERYPKLNKDEPYIFVCNHTCPEDIETVLNVLDRNAYLVLGSIESLKYNPEMYLSFLNGMIPFDILDKGERKVVFEKMKRILKTNSILIFPEGSHNYSPNKLVNNLFDGPVNLALQTKRKIVIVTLVRDQENNISYMDIGNPIDIEKINVNIDKALGTAEEIEKQYVKQLTSIIRDKMATAVYYIIERHFKMLNREEYNNIEEELRMKKIKDAFKKLKWDKDVFEAEYLTKKTNEEQEQEEVTNVISNLVINSGMYGENNYWCLQKGVLSNQDVVYRMRKYLDDIQKEKKLRK